ncbi:alpha/beta hydrolase family protein [Nocardia halotolerans]|uniref:Alpha/beta hydrolase family protein n=1 Tax=Nocardia halotolerans TaxID=1755878 RepID=A0ABV8VJY9_9NOCA
MGTELVEAMFSRATGAGIDPHDYHRALAGVAAPGDWAPACAAAADRHRDAPAGSAITRGDHLVLSARWSHLATLVPDAHHLDHARAADLTSEQGFSLLSAGVRRIDGRDFTGILREPNGPAVGTVIVVPGLDSSKEEFHVLADALIRRGAAVFAMDGPGQGTRLATTTLSAAYPDVISAVIDELGIERAGVVGLSLGGYYGAAAAAADPRITVAASVSGPSRLDWAHLPGPVRELMARRAGSLRAAAAFAATVDLSDSAAHVRCRLLVVDGGADVVPGVTDGALLAQRAPRGRYLRIPGGDHLVGNDQQAWLPAVADHLTGGLR